MNSPSSSNSQPQNHYKDNLMRWFKSAASSLTQIHIMALQAYEGGYAQGRQEAFEDVFKWFTHHQDNTFKYVSNVSFFSYITEKLAEVNSKYAQGKFEINSD